MKTSEDFAVSCPTPASASEVIQLAHGGGGRMMHDLLKKIFYPAFANDALQAEHDGAALKVSDARLAFTTDSYVVKPLFFPGGNIGSLAVYGTANDLAMCGARPLYLSAGFILEEGLPIAVLECVADAMRQCAQAADVQIVTGDTKVVDKGKGDGLYINTAGIGIREHDLTIAPRSVKLGDVVLLSGDIGRHGVAIMAQREGLDFETTIESDCAPLSGLVQGLLAAGVHVHCLRDLTRGGLASALVEIAQSAGVHIHVEGKTVPVREDVRGACEILGLDPLYVACEGRMIAFVPESESDLALSCLRKESLGSEACRIGRVEGDRPGLVTLRSEIGAIRVVDMLSGEQLPRIC